MKALAKSENNWQIAAIFDHGAIDMFRRDICVVQIAKNIVEKYGKLFIVFDYRFLYIIVIKLYKIFNHF
jgi:hypothetical protein